MASIAQIRGLILEEIVLALLTRIGYRIIQAGEEGTRNRQSGLEVKGRGDWHQIDAFAALEYVPPFMYPLRLILEAKCYDGNRRVGIEVARNLLGVVTDISQNYFSYMPGTPGSEIQMQRFNYHGAIFSTSEYTRPTQRYSIAHQIFLIQYRHISLMEPIVRKLLDLRSEHFYLDETRRRDDLIVLASLRQNLRRYFSSADPVLQGDFVSDEAKIIFTEVREQLARIGGSYYGIVQGLYPLHLLSEKPLPAELFSDTDQRLCRIFFRQNKWAFAPSDVQEGDERYFELEFDLPKEIALVIKKRGDNWRAKASVKPEYMSYVDIVGLIGGVRRFVRLKLDRDWLAEYISQRAESEGWRG